MPKQQMLTWGLIALGWLGGLTHGVGWANEINADWQLAKQDRGGGGLHRCGGWVKVFSL